MESQIQPTTQKTILRPRSKQKLEHHYNTPDIYKSYKENKKANNQPFLSYKEYTSIIYAFNKELEKELLHNSNSFAIPYNLGVIRIKKIKKALIYDSPLPIDFKATTETGVTTFLLNNHSNFARYKFYWKKPRIKNIQAYCFIPCRTIKRNLAYCIKSLKIDYLT